MVYLFHPTSLVFKVYVLGIEYELVATAMATAVAMDVAMFDSTLDDAAIQPVAVAARFRPCPNWRLQLRPDIRLDCRVIMR